MAHSNSRRPEQAPIIDVVIRGVDPLCEPGRTTTTRELAQGVLDALAEAGYVIVPREPTEAMQDAGGSCGGFEFDGESGTVYPAPIWRAMVDAALGGTP